MVERNKDMSWPSFVAFILEEAEVEEVPIGQNDGNLHFDDKSR